MTAEFLVHIVFQADGVAEDQLDRLRAAESARAAELAQDGHLVKLWRLPEGWSNVGVWRAATEHALRELLDSLPLRPYMTIAVQRLLPHPNDPSSS